MSLAFMVPVVHHVQVCILAMIVIMEYHVAGIFLREINFLNNSNVQRQHTSRRNRVILWHMPNNCTVSNISNNV